MVLNFQIASESHHISVIHVYDTDGEGVEGWRGEGGRGDDGVLHNRDAKANRSPR